MLQITEHTAARLVLRDRSPVLGLAIGIFALLCLALMVVVPLHNIILLLFAPLSANALRVTALATLAVVGMALAVAAVTTSAQLWYGTTCIFDKPSATVTVIRPHRLRLRQVELPLYGVSHLEVESSGEARAHALYLVLRSYERVLLASVSVYDQERIETVRSQVRAFLRA